MSRTRVPIRKSYDAHARYHPGRVSAGGKSGRSKGVKPNQAALLELTSISDILLHRVSRGDQAAIRECIARFGGLVWSLARRIGLSDAECEDAVQEIFTEIWQNGYRYDASIASETAFVATIARRRLIDRRRKLGRQVQKQTITEATPIPPADAVQPGLPDEARRAAAALTQLSTEQQRVLRLSVYEGLSHELIARSTGLPLGTVKTHARRGLIKLRELLTGEGGDSTSGADDSSAVATSDASPNGSADRGSDGARGGGGGGATS